MLVYQMQDILWLLGAILVALVIGLLVLADIIVTILNKITDAKEKRRNNKDNAFRVRILYVDNTVTEHTYSTIEEAEKAAKEFRARSNGDIRYIDII